MPITVVCPGCRKSFQVQDKFAGKSGPCPKCKTPIKVPEKAQEVKIHGGEDFSTGGRTASGQLALKPIARRQVKFKPAMAGAIGGAVVGVMILSWIGGKIVAASTPFVGYSLITLFLLLLSPVLVLAAYDFLYDDELEPYRDKPLYLRAAACAATYVVLWGFFAYVKGIVQPTDQIYLWLMITAPLLGAGGFTAHVALDLETGSAFLHYAFYAVVTFVLSLIAGIPWITPPT
jgi:hypothetical protein